MGATGSPCSKERFRGIASVRILPNLIETEREAYSLNIAAAKTGGHPAPIKPSKAWECSEMHIQKGRLVLREADISRDGTGQHDRGLVRGALTFFDTAISIDRESSLAWVGRARTLRELDELEEAEISIVRASRLDPENPMILVEHALL